MEEIVHPKGKIYYSMGEVCELFGVNASLLRFWESEFPILKIAKNSRGHRIYTTSDVDNLRLIYHLVKEQGMTLDGARKRLRQNREGVSRDAEIVERLRSIRNMLAALKAELGEDVEVIDIDDEDVAPERLSAEEVSAEEVAAVEEVATTEEVVTTEEVASTTEEVLASAIEEEVASTAEEATTECAEPYAVPEPAKEQLADFTMQMPSSEPQHEEPKKPRTPKMGTLIGGDLFSPEDIRLAVAKKNSKESKKQVIEQTLF